MFGVKKGEKQEQTTGNVLTCQCDARLIHFPSFSILRENGVLGDEKSAVFSRTVEEPYYDDDEVETDSSEEMLIERPQ